MRLFVDAVGQGMGVTRDIGDSYENLPEDLRPIGDAIAAFRQVIS